MRQPKYWLFGLYCVLSLALQAQNATLSGIITDQATQEGLYPATIKIGSIGTITDFDGRFEISLAEGEHVVEISYVGYETYQTSVLLTANAPNELNIELSETVNLLQTATVTTGRYEKPLGEATVSLEVLTSDLIESTNATSLDQSLEKIPGVNIVGGQANVRGGSGFSYGAGSRVLVLVNDLPALQADAGVSNWGDLPVESIEQVEIVKGAASALYGSAALNGIFNIRTAYARSEPETKISLFGGVFSAPQAEAKKWWPEEETKYEAGMLVSHKQKIDKLDLVIGARLYTKEDPREGFGNDQGRGSLGLRYRISDRFTVGFNSIYNKQKNRSYFYWKNSEEGIFQKGEGLGASRPTRFYFDPFASYYDKAGNRHKFTGRFYSIDNKSEAGDTDNFSDQYYGEYQFQRNFEKTNLVLTAGGVASRTNVTAPLYGDTSYVLTNNAAYIQLEKRVGDKLNLSGGLRYEYNRIQGPVEIVGFAIPDGRYSDSRPVFRMGMNYQVDPRLFLRASWGQGFRFPTIAEKYITTQAAGFPIFPNPELISETGWSSEVGLKKGFTISNWQGYLDAAAFWMEYQDMAEFVVTTARGPNGLPVVGFQAQNIGNTVIKGVDFSLTGQGKIGTIPIAILTGYTYVDPQFKEFTEEDKERSSVDYNVLKYRFKHSVKVDVESTFGPVKIGLALIRNSHMEAVDALFEIIIPGLTPFRTANNNGYYLWNARASYQLTEQFKVSALVNNLTNIEYSTRPGLLEPTRLWSARVDYLF